MSRKILAAALAGALAFAPMAAFAATATTAGAEAALKSTIADIQAGKPDYSTMVPQLADAVKAQPGSAQQLAALGAPTAFARVGEGENPWVWDVTFENGVVLTWTISIDADGKIAGLFVQPKG